MVVFAAMLCSVAWCGAGCHSAPYVVRILINCPVAAVVDVPAVTVGRGRSGRARKAFTGRSTGAALISSSSNSRRRW